MQRIILLAAFIVIVGVLGKGEEKSPISAQEDVFVKYSGEANHARTVRDAINKGKKITKKAGKNAGRKTFKRKQRKEKNKGKKITKKAGKNAGGKTFKRKQRKDKNKGKKITKKARKNAGRKTFKRKQRKEKNKGKKITKKAGKKAIRKTFNRKQKKQNLKTRRKTKGDNRKKNRNAIKKGQKIKKKIKTTRKGKRKVSKKSKQQGSLKKTGKKNRQETCTEIDDLCITNAIEAMEFEKKQIKNFIKQKNRIEKQSELAGNKYKKNGGFAKSAAMMLSALGNNTSSPECSTNESLNNAMTNYETLNGCEESIKTACTLDETILNDNITANLENCKKSFDEIKVESKKCQDIDSDLTEACNCWGGNVTKIIEEVKNDIKNGKCSAKTTDNNVKKAKNDCLTAFIICKKAEDAAVGLIHNCTMGEVKTRTADGTLE